MKKTTAKKAPAKPVPAAKPIKVAGYKASLHTMPNEIGKPGVKPGTRPTKGKGSGKPNYHQRAQALGIDRHLPDAPMPEIEFIIDPDLVEELEKCRGRPTVLTSELGSRICSLVAQRKSLMEIEEMGDGLPSEATVYRWLAADPNRGGAKGKLYGSFQVAFARARELRAKTRSEAIHNYERKLTDMSIPAANRLDPQIVRVAVELQRVLMEVEDPMTYSRRLALQGGGKGAPPIVVAPGKLEMSREELEAIARGGLDDQDE